MPCSNSASRRTRCSVTTSSRGSWRGPALVSDIELIDDYPTHFSAYSRRKHRWMRGDWQILRWLMPRVPDGLGRMVENHFNAISRWKILDNLRRSLLEPATLLLLLAGWFVLRGGAGLWTALSVAMLLLPDLRRPGGLAAARAVGTHRLPAVVRSDTCGRSHASI